MDYKIIEFKGKSARQYPDGTIRDDRGRALSLPKKLSNHAITSETAQDMLAIRRAKRAQLATEGAMLGVQDAALIAQYGHDAAFVERARTLQEISTTPDAGKAAVMAAQYADKLQGYVEDPKDQAPAADQPVTLALVQLLGAITRRLDGEPVIPTRLEIEADAE